MQNFQNLLVWQKAHELALHTYRLTVDFPREEAFGLRNSLRRTAIDIPGFIAEGCGKTNDADFSKALGVALGFANRLQYYALVAHDLGLINETPYAEYDYAIVEVKKMLSGFNRRLG